MAKAGWGGGNPEKVLEMRTDMVMAIVQYEGFVSDYERAYLELNKGKE